MPYKTSSKSTSATNIGDGVGIFSQLSGNTLIFQTISGGTGVSLNESNGLITINSIGGSSSLSGENVTKEITQTSHGFSVGDFVGWSGGTYNKAIADGSYNGEFIGLVTDVPNTNEFKLTQSGYATGLTGLVASDTYWLSASVAGSLTNTEPSNEGEISKAVLIADTTTSAWIFPYTGYVITATGDTSIELADNGLNKNGTTVELGGTLCKNTTICLNDYSMTFSDSGTTSCSTFLQTDSLINNTVKDNVDTNIFGNVSTNKYTSSLKAGSAVGCCSSINSEGLGRISFIVCGDSANSHIKICDRTSSQNGIQYDQCYSTGFTSSCSLVDKGYVDSAISGATGGGNYTLNSPSTCTVGGISAGTALTGKTLECLLQDILAPYIEPTFTSFNISQSTYTEVGEVVSGTRTFTWATSTSGNIVSNSVGICDITNAEQLEVGLANDGYEVLAINTMSNTAPTTWTWQISGCSTQSTSFTRNATRSSIYPIYWGVETCATRPAVNNTLVVGGSKVVDSSTSTVTVDFNSSNQWTWVAIPSTSTSKTCWYVTTLNNGNMGNVGDKYPDECVLAITSAQGCWSSINYKVYMSGFAATDADPIQFRNS